MFITRKSISRRAALRGIGGAMVALPTLEAMTPAMARAAKPAVRLACLEMVHGSAGATRFGISKNMWSPVAAGNEFDLTPTAMKPLEPYRKYLTIVSNTDTRMAEAFSDNEVGGDHNRCSAAYLTQAKPRQTL